MHRDVPGSGEGDLKAANVVFNVQLFNDRFNETFGRGQFSANQHEAHAITVAQSIHGNRLELLTEPVVSACAKQQEHEDHRRSLWRFDHVEKRGGIRRLGAWKRNDRGRFEGNLGLVIDRNGIKHLGFQDLLFGRRGKGDSDVHRSRFGLDEDGFRLRFRF